MATKSDFAQKLLNDLKLRKERMATSQNMMSRDASGHPGQTHNGYAKIKAPEFIGSTKGNSFRKSTGGSKSFYTDSSQSQIVPYGRGRSSEQKGDLSMALSFAFGNGGSRTKMDISGNNAVINFLHNIGRRSQKKMETKGSLEIYNPSNRSSTISTLHITEVSKGVQKLNQIITACSNGFTVDGHSIEVGKELLRGAMDLEESLRMLVNLQEASDYVVSAQRKNKIKLLEEEEEEDKECAITKIADKRQVDRPKFSFDKRSKNSQGTKGSANNYIKQHLMALTYPDESPKSNEKKSPGTSNMVHHKRSASCVSEFKSFSTSSEAENCSNISHAKPEKGRISNVIAKLMGLEEIPQRENQKATEKELSSKRKEAKISRRSLSSAEIWIRDTENRPLSTISKSTAQVNSMPATRDTRLVLERDLQEFEVAVRKDVTSSPHHDTSQSNRFPVYHRSSHGENKEVNKSQNKITNNTHESKELFIKKELQHKVPQKHNISRDDAECKEKEADIEEKTISRIQPSKQQKYQGNQNLQHLQRLQDFERQEEKTRAGRREHPLARRKLLAGERKRSEREPIISSKPKNSAFSRKNQPGAVQDTARKKTFMTPSNAVPSKDASKSTHCEGFPHQKAPVQGPPIVKKATYTQGHGRESAEDVETVANLSRPLKSQSRVLQEIEQQENKNISIVEEPSQLSYDQSKEAVTDKEVSGDGFHRSDELGEILYGTKEVQGEAKDLSSLCSPDNDRSQFLEVPETLFSSDNDPVIDVCNVANAQHHDEQTSISGDAELEVETTSLEHSNGTDEETIQLDNQFHIEDNKVPSAISEEPLTEPEEHLKETLIKSRLILNTTELLFKFNNPVNIPQPDDHNDHDSQAKLTIDSAYEIIRRKGRKQELKSHPFSRISISFTNINSFHDLVKQLCKDFDTLKFYGGYGGYDERDATDYLQQMIEKDIENGFSDVNSVWDYGWYETTFAFLEKHEIIKDVEKHVLNGLLDEITRELLLDFNVLV